MCSGPSAWTDNSRRELRAILAESGVEHFGVADACEVDPAVINDFTRWIEAGHHGSMAYLANHIDIRRDPRLLLEGASSVISCAIPYFDPDATPTSPHIARYALGDDYHEVIRHRLAQAAERIKTRFGGDVRVCVDTAPILERYWAVRSGLGFIGRNHQLIVEGVGSNCFLAELITTAHFHPDTPCTLSCQGCDRCILACPGRALAPDGDFDARRCISYLTIEHRGDFPEGTDLHGCLYGCDVCADVCPHNQQRAATPFNELRMRPEYTRLTAERCATMSQEEFSRMFSHSAIKRTKLTGLRRNALTLLHTSHPFGIKDELNEY